MAVTGTVDRAKKVPGLGQGKVTSEADGRSERDDFGDRHVLFVHAELSDRLLGFGGAAMALTRFEGDHHSAGFERTVGAGDGGSFIFGMMQGFVENDGVEIGLAVE